MAVKITAIHLCHLQPRPDKVSVHLPVGSAGRHGFTLHNESAYQRADGVTTRDCVHVDSHFRATLVQEVQVLE